ncbi:MAG: DEAD/DEAH box helicase family protein, partial [Ktedonobacteraceae bacterium]
RCLDLVAFVNGLPVVVLTIEESELPHIHARIEQEMRPELPALLWYNAFLVVANAFTCRMGSFTTPWEHYFQWKRVESEDESESTTLETLLRGTCEPTHLLDIIENFTLFDHKGGLKKLVARNHQYLGVNKAVAAVDRREAMPEEQRESKLGVFWHTQGSGKSYSMIFFVLKILRKISHSYKFLIVTDRQDLDQQIYENFNDVDAIIEHVQEVHARDGEHLKQMLREPHFVLFTLIQKFSVEKPGMDYEQLSESTKIIVISDEAHRTQDKTLAKNMRSALPRAAFIGFTGTPLIEGEDQQTRETFGGYVSVYHFRRAIRDGVTVPLRFENHTPELKFIDERQFDVNMQQLLDDPRIDPQQKQNIIDLATHPERLLANSERLDWVASDIVEHFMGRGYQGKAMI